MQKQQLMNVERDNADRCSVNPPTSTEAREAAFRELRLPPLRGRERTPAVEVPEDLQRRAAAETLEGSAAFEQRNVAEIWDRGFSAAQRYAEQHGYTLRYEASGVHVKGLDAEFINAGEFQRIIARDRQGKELEIGMILPEKQHISLLHSSAELYSQIVGAFNEKLKPQLERPGTAIVDRLQEMLGRPLGQDSQPVLAGYGYASETQHTAAGIRISFPGDVPPDIFASKVNDPELYSLLSRMEAQGYSIAAETNVKRPAHLYLMDRNGVPVQDFGSFSAWSKPAMLRDLRQSFGGLDVVLRDDISHEELEKRNVSLELLHGRSSGKISVGNLAGVGEAVLRADDKTSHFRLEYARDERGEKTSTILLTAFDKTIEGSHIQTVLRIPADGHAEIESPRRLPFPTPVVRQPDVHMNPLEQKKSYFPYPEVE